MTRFSPSRAHIILILLLLFGIAGVTSTYTRLSMTDDEGFHISCGMEWLKDGTYKIQPLHPPLARAMDAVFLYMANSFYHGKAWEGMPPRDVYIDKMILTRLGTLPFYVLSCMLVFMWSRKLFGEMAALFSLALYVSLSSVTAHAALATTDMDYTAVFLWALMCGIDWLQSPDRKHSVLLGLGLGLMTGTKYSGLAQWPAAMAVIVIAQSLFNYRKSLPLHINRRHLINAACYSLPLIVAILALVFHFSFEPLINGIRDAERLSSGGFGVWFYGLLQNHGVWYFFPVVFFFKTPLTFLAATLIGNGRIIRELPGEHSMERLFPLLAALGILLISMTSNVNLGVRHVLLLYPLLAIPAGYGVSWLWSGKMWKPAIAAALLSCQLVSFIHAYPEHIAYFNVLAGDHPEHITLDSDFDWGQDMILLDEELQARGITTAYMCSRRDTFWNAAVVVHAKILPCPKEPVSGWVAVGRAFMQLSDKTAWLKGYEALQIRNSTMNLYYIPPNQ